MDSGTGSQYSKYYSTCWRWKIITSQLLMLLIRWTSGTTEWTFMTNCPSSLKTFLLRLHVRRTLKGVFLCAACLLLVAETEWPSHCKCELVWNWKISVGEHRHQCLCVNFGTLTLMEMNCKWVSTKAAIQYFVVWQILCCVLLLNVNWNCALKYYI